MNLFTWGIEYETNLLIHKPNGIDREVIWKRDKTQLSTEFWDVLFHKPYPVDNKYYLHGIPSDDAGRIFNIESQLGIFKGINSLSQAMQNIDILTSVLVNLVQSQQIVISNTVYPLHEFISLNDGDSRDGLFLDLANKMPGVYPGKNDDGTICGYKNKFDEYSIYGKPQITISMPLSSVPKMFEMLYQSSTYYQEYEMPLTIAESLLLRIDSISKLNKSNRAQVHGFLLYLLHYFTSYEYYIKLKEDKVPTGYFKSVFLTKPRTNPSILFTSLNKVQQDAIIGLIDILSHEPLPIPEWSRYLQELVPSLTAQKCVYTKGNNLGRDIPNALFNYDKEDVVTYMGMEEYKSSFSLDVPCVDPYDPNNIINSPIPTISYLGEDDWNIEGSAPNQIWEWKSTGAGMVSFEFRDLNEMSQVCLTLLGKDSSLPEYSALFEASLVSPETLKLMITLLFDFFQELFQGATRSRKSAKKQK